MTDKSSVTAGDVARAMLSGDRVSATFGIELLEATAGEVRLGMVVTDDMLNGFGTCHGGILFTLADTALSCVCNGHNQRSVAHHCSIVFLRPGNPGERLVATATERSVIGRIGIYDVSVVDEAGAVIGEFFGHAREIGGKVVNHG